MDDDRTTDQAAPQPSTHWFERVGALSGRRPATPPRQRPVSAEQPRNETTELVTRAINWTYR